MRWRCTADLDEGLQHVDGRGLSSRAPVDVEEDVDVCAAAARGLQRVHLGGRWPARGQGGAESGVGWGKRGRGQEEGLCMYGKEEEWSVKVLFVCVCVCACVCVCVCALARARVASVLT